MKTDKEKAMLLFRKGKQLHGVCYPFGVNNRYEACVSLFRKALEFAKQSSDTDMLPEIEWALEDAAADVAYYRNEDYAEAARRYRNASERALLIADQADNPKDARFWMSCYRYGKAVAEESEAFVSAAQGMHNRSLNASFNALMLYADEAAVSDENAPYNLHSAVGTIGDILETLAAGIETRLPRLAIRLLEDALRYYEDALRYNPLWKEAKVSDNHDRWAAQLRRKIDELRQKI